MRIRVVDSRKNPVAGADLLLIARDGRHWEQFSSQDGSVLFPNLPGEAVGVFCARDGYSGFYLPQYDPSRSLEATLSPKSSGGWLQDNR